MSERPRQYYFDNNATTRVAPEVVEAMLPYLTEWWGNASSAYAFGRDVRQAIERARKKVAHLIHADPAQVIFTSCGTESNNAAIHSALMANPGKRHVITTSVEHSANIKYCQFLKKQGYDVTFLPVESDGSIDIHLIEQTIRPDTAIVSMMWANNETGVLYPVDEVAAICQAHGALFHTDAVQAAGKIKLDVKSSHVDFLSLSAHKLHAPKGIGLLYVKPGIRYQPFVMGGSQESGRRGGTENVPYIVGFGEAAQMAEANISLENTAIRALRDRLEDGILKTIPGVARNGARDLRLPNTSNLSFDGIEAEAVLLKLDQAGICVSSGSACMAGSIQPSHVLIAMGVSPARAKGSLRFSLGMYNTAEEVDYVLEKLPEIVRSLRKTKP